MTDGLLRARLSATFVCQKIYVLSALVQLLLDQHLSSSLANLFRRLPLTLAGLSSRLFWMLLVVLMCVCRLTAEVMTAKVTKVALSEC